MAFNTKWAYGLIPLMSLLGCETTRHDESKEVSYIYSNAPWQNAVRKAVAKLQAEDLDGASFEINLALQNFPKKPSLHLMNGLIYEEKALREGGEFIDLALVGYKNALTFDPGNWYAYYRMGLVKLKEANYLEAQELLSRASLLQPQNPDILYSLAMASYYAGDLRAARLSIHKAMGCQKKENFLFLRAAALISAATGDQKESERYLEQLKQKVGDQKPDLVNIQGRVEKWLSVHQKNLYKQVQSVSQDKNQDADGSLPASSPKNEKEKAPSGGVPKPSPSPQSSSEHPKGSTSEPPPQEKPNPVVIFDCCLLTIKEDIQNTKGMNIFSLQKALKVSLQPQSLTYNYTLGTPGAAATLTKSIVWPVIDYNLNIMNLIDNRVEILGRPTISTFLNTKGTFSSGITLSAGISGGSGGSLVNIVTGTILSITPSEIKDGVVTLNIELESCLPKLDAGNFSPQKAFTEQVLQLLKTKVNTTLRLAYNETGMVGGVYSRTTQYSQDGFPILQDIPVVQLFTAQESTLHEKLSALFLVTPRRSDDLKTGLEKTGTDSKKLPSMREWLERQTKSKDALLTLIVQNVAPKNAQEFYQRGDILPINDSPLESLYNEVVSLPDFLYY